MTFRFILHTKRRYASRTPAFQSTANELIQIGIALGRQRHNLIKIVTALGFHRDGSLIANRLQMLHAPLDIDNTVTDRHTNLLRIDILGVTVNDTVSDPLEHSKLVLST